MNRVQKFALTALLTVFALNLTGCAADYYDYRYDDYVDYGPPDIIICPGPPHYPEPEPYPGPVIVAEKHPRPLPLPKPVVEPPARTKEPDRQPRNPAPRTPKPREGGAKNPVRNGSVRR